MTKQTTKWLYGMPLLDGIVYRLTIFGLKVVGFFAWRLQLSGLDKLPKTEPFLLLGNHSSMLDPFWAGMYVPRGVKSMASAAVLNVPYLGKWLQMCGCFPKMKYTKDRNSMRLLQDNFEAGYPILLFPEGNRSWDGRLGEVGQGIGRLIARLQCKVVYVTLPSASLYQPRWATYPRWVPVEVNYDGPYEYRSQDPEEIWQDVIKKITVTPKLIPNKRTFGYKMAHGLPQFLWACPQCFTIDGLQVDPKNGNDIDCTHCKEHWTVTIDNHLIGESKLPIASAFDKIAQHFGTQPRTTVPTSTIVLQCPNAKILRREDSTMKTLGKGTLSITTTGLQLEADDNLCFEVLHADITAISVEIANLLQFRIDGVVHRIVTPKQSSLMWAFFLRGWQT